MSKRSTAFCKVFYETCGISNHLVLPIKPLPKLIGSRQSRRKKILAATTATALCSALASLNTKGLVDKCFLHVSIFHLHLNLPGRHVRLASLVGTLAAAASGIHIHQEVERDFSLISLINNLDNIVTKGTPHCEIPLPSQSFKKKKI